MKKGIKVITAPEPTQVAEQEVLEPTAVEEMKIGNWDLTLFTCTYGGQMRMALRCFLIE